MIKHKNAVIAGLMIAIALIVAFVRGGNAPSLTTTQQPMAVSQLTENHSGIQTHSNISSQTEQEPEFNEQQVQSEQLQPAGNSEPKSEQTQSVKQETATETEQPQMYEQNVQQTKPTHPAEKTAESNNEIGQLTCTLAVTCGTILDNMSWLDEAKHSLVPADGVIYKRQAVTFSEGESVFDVLNRAMKNAKIHFEFVSTPAYDSIYIEGINNLYEFDCGELSGWMYKVNGVFPNYGCSKYKLNDGDNIEFVYTCDLGADVGNKYKRLENN